MQNVMVDNIERIIEIVKSAKGIVFDEKLRRDIHMKGAADFVTAVDTEISNSVKLQLKKHFPHYGFFSEEEDGALSDPCWILDPIDGTTNLVYGYQQCSISLALYSGGEIVVGVVYNPFYDECFYAERGKSAFYNGEQIHVSPRAFSNGIVEFGAGSTKKELTEENFDIAKEIFRNVIDLRRICSSALSICYIAQGRIDGYFEKVLKPWDYAAGALILQEAGGIITDYSGKLLSFDTPSSVIAGNPDTHKGVFEIIRRYYHPEKEYEE